MTVEPIANPSDSPPPRETRARVIGCFLLTVAALQLVLGPSLRITQWSASAEGNAGIAEGVAWLHGRLDIDSRPGLDQSNPANRLHDTAYFDGRVYNVFPPLVGFLTVLLAPLSKLLEIEPGRWLTLPYTLLVFWPLPLVGFIAFRAQTRDPVWAGLLTVAWMAGTALCPNLRFARLGYLGQMNHVLSQIGLLILTADLLGKRRTGPAIIGLAIAAWSRQMCLLYALPLLWLAYKRGRLLPAAIGVGLVVAPLLTLNALKFGNPLEFGYANIYTGRDAELIAQRCLQHGTFSPNFLRENAYYMHVASPRFERTPTGFHISEANGMGTSIWLTTPLLLWIVLAVPRWWPDPARRTLFLATLAVMAGLLCYHSPGYLQHGYNRFALDFIPVWLLIVAPWTRGGWRAWFTLSATAYSLLYFQALTPAG